MKDNYDLSKLKKKKGEVKVDPEATTITVSIRLNAVDLGDIKVEAERRGVPYQTLINSILHMFATGELIDRKEQEGRYRVAAERILKGRSIGRGIIETEAAESNDFAYPLAETVGSRSK